MVTFNPETVLSVRDVTIIQTKSTIHKPTKIFAYERETFKLTDNMNRHVF